MPEGCQGQGGEGGRPAGISRLLKKSTSGVLASLASQRRRSGLRGSTYCLGKRLFTQAMGSPVKRVYAWPLCYTEIAGRMMASTNCFRTC